jgi:hypothetical protein
MATPVLLSGDHAKVVSAGITMPATKWSMKIASNPRNYTNNRDGRKRVAGVPDASGSVNMPYDHANEPTAVGLSNIRHGSLLTLNLYVDDTHFYGVKVIVDDVNPEAETEGDINFSFNWSMSDYWDTTASPAVAILYPTYP